MTIKSVADQITDDVAARTRKQADEFEKVVTGLQDSASATTPAARAAANSAILGASGQIWLLGIQNMAELMLAPSKLAIEIQKVQVP